MSNLSPQQFPGQQGLDLDGAGYAEAPHAAFSALNKQMEEMHWDNKSDAQKLSETYKKPVVSYHTGRDYRHPNPAYGSFGARAEVTGSEHLDKGRGKVFTPEQGSALETDPEVGSLEASLNPVHKRGLGHEVQWIGVGEHYDGASPDGSGSRSGGKNWFKGEGIPGHLHATLRASHPDRPVEHSSTQWPDGARLERSGQLKNWNAKDMDRNVIHHHPEGIGTQFKFVLGEGDSPHERYQP